MKGIHLFNHSQNGVEIQFYVLMSVAILMLKLKQDSQALEKEEVESEKEKRAENSRNPSEWIKNIAQVFYKSWKITKNWLIVVRNSLAQVADYRVWQR